MTRAWRRFDTWLGRRSLKGAGSIIFLGSIISGSSSAVPWPWRWISIGAGAVLTLAAGWVGLQRTRLAEEQAASAESQVMLAVNRAFHPLSTVLNATISARTHEGRVRSSERAVATALYAALAAISPQSGHIRVCWYVLAAGPERLVPDLNFGRDPKPTTVFAEGTPEGDDALDLAKRGRQLLVEDVGKQPNFRTYHPSAATYHTYMAVGVAAGGTGFGMLTVDAEEAGILTQADLQTLDVIAAMLGGALYAASGRAED